MGNNFWMIVLNPEDYTRYKNEGFKHHSMKSLYRKRAQRMEINDRVLIYISGLQKWPATTILTSKYFETETQVAKSRTRRADAYPYCVNMKPDIVLEDHEFIDARELAPRLEYIKRWPPERWPLALMGSLHLIPQRDYRLVEGEMKRILQD